MNAESTTLLVAGPLPPICLKCAGEDRVSAHRRRFAIVGDPGSLADVGDVASLLNDTAGGALGIAGFVRTLQTTREAELEIPLCDGCADAWQRARRAHHAALGVGIAATAAGIIALCFGPRLEGTTAYVVAGLFTVLAIAAVRGVPSIVEARLLRPRALTARRIDERGVVLGGVSDRFRDAVEAYVRTRRR